MKPKDGRKALIVFSDGADRGSKETLNDAIDAADRANVQVFTIYFKGEEEHRRERLSRRWPPRRQGGHGGMWWRRLSRRRRWLSRRWRRAPRRQPAAARPESTARRSCSRSPHAPAASSSKPKRKTTSTRFTTRSPASLRQQYLLTYTPDKVDTEGEFHKIVLKTSKTDLTVITREGYYAPTPDK